MKPSDREIIISIVKRILSSGLIASYSDFQKDLLAEPEDVLQIISEVESRFGVEFNHSEHFKAKSIDDICKILDQKKGEQPMIASFGGLIES